MLVFLTIIASYLLGSVPAGYLAGRMAKIDIRQTGSGNIGATNVVRVLGKAYGYPVFAFDFLKGLVAVSMSIFFSRTNEFGISVESLGIIGGVCAVIGHSYPVWLRFKGGKGVATSLGVIFGLAPIAAVIVVILWVCVFAITRYVSIASIAAAVALPAATFFLLRSNVILYFTIALMLIVIWRHRSNISRLMKGAEPRFERK